MLKNENTQNTPDVCDENSLVHRLETDLKRWQKEICCEPRSLDKMQNRLLMERKS